jgi:hypothetical protein
MSARNCRSAADRTTYTPHYLDGVGQLLPHPSGTNRRLSGQWSRDSGRPTPLLCAIVSYARIRTVSGVSRLQRFKRAAAQPTARPNLPTS